jgi:hypothetical protein
MWSRTMRLRLLGQQRADLFANVGWRELRSELAPNGEEATLIVRRVEDNKGPRLVYNLKQGASETSGDVRYGYYPSSWFLNAFPDGWRSLAEREGFELPKDFPSR